MTQPFDLDAMRADMEAGTQPPWHIKAKSVPMSIEGSIHQVTDAASFPAAFVPAWDNPELGETDGTEEALANARRIARVPAMEAEILRLTAENERLRENALSKMSPDCAPKGVPVLVAGGIAMRKTGGEWFSGMCEPTFSRHLEWEPQWWAPIPQQNEPPCEALSQAPTYAQGYADALEAAEMACNAMAAKWRSKPEFMVYAPVYEAEARRNAAAIRALPIKEKPMCDPLSDPRVKALVAEVGKHLVTMESTGFPTRQLYDLRAALADVQKEQDT